VPTDTYRLNLLQFLSAKTLLPLPLKNNTIHFCLTCLKRQKNKWTPRFRGLHPTITML